MNEAPGPNPADGQPLASPLAQIQAEDGATVEAKVIPVALTAGSLLFEDGATQVFNADGTTTYTERGRPSEGTWYVEGQSFCSFWPPSYTGCYDLTWLVEDNNITGLRFADLTSRTQFVGRYQPQPPTN